jgi:arabinose-5-phosphate isomerase
MDFVASGRKVMDLEIQSLQALKDRLNGDFSKAVELMMDTLEGGGKFVFTGVGKSGHVANKIAATMTSTGAPSIYLNPLDAMHGDMGIIQAGDLVIILSHSGETQEMLQLLPSIKRFDVKIITMTGKQGSTIAKEGDLHLDTSVEKEACPLNLAPTSSTTTMLVLGDALAMVLLEARGFGREDFGKYHPGGTIGRTLLLKVDVVMRPRDVMAICKPEETVATAIARISEKRCGAAVIVDDAGKLAGIYTHGDFARGFQKNKNIGDVPLREVLTPKPVFVYSDKLAVEVLNLFERHRIQDLIVLDHEQKPVGLVDVMDLARLKFL